MPKRSKKLPRKEVEKMFYQLCFAISEMNNPEDLAEFLRDLLSYQEAEMIAKRLKIAELILDGLCYDEIQKRLGAGSGTIARVQEWLLVSGGGYRSAVEKSKKIKKVQSASDAGINPRLSELKRKFPTYYWPEFLLENLITTMNKREKARISKVVNEMGKMREKTDLYKKLKSMGI